MLTSSRLLSVLIFQLFFLFSQGSAFSQQIKSERLADGVERWYRVKTSDEKPWFYKQMEGIFNVILPEKNALPFGESIAFLVGVSQYSYLKPQLPFVKNDLIDLRKFLLDKGGFDVVYVAANGNATPELIEDYMTNIFRKSLGKKDRLLFYYSGHGADLGGTTGYIQFSLAKSDDFARHVLAIRRCMEWSSIIPAAHVLFIFDCCASGLAFTPKSGESDAYKQLVSALSGNGSRTVITAGTSDEKTYEVKDSRGRGNGVFTRALLNAMAYGGADQRNDGFMTINEIFAQAEIGVKNFAAIYKKKLSPRRWELQEDEYRGTFVLVNPVAKNITLSDAYSKALKARPRGEVVASFGAIQLISYISGKVYIDDRFVDDIAKGDAKVYDRPIGRHKIAVQGSDETVTKTVNLRKGQTETITIRPKQFVTKQPVPDISETTTSPILRSSPNTNLSYADVKSMLTKHDFYIKETSWNDEFNNPKGLGFKNEFQTQKNGQVIYDAATELTWQQSGSSSGITFKEAQAYLQKLNTEKYAGFGDWRLPTLEEAMSLMEPEKMNGDLHIDSKFDKTQSYIRTADKYSASWGVNFIGAYCLNDDFGHVHYFVRAVR